MKLRVKLIIAFSSIVVIMGMLQSGFFHNRMEINFDNYIDKNENRQTEFWQMMLIDYYEKYRDWDDVQLLLAVNNWSLEQGRKWDIFPGRDDLEIIVVNNEGIVVGDSDNKWLGKSSKNIKGMYIDLFLDSEKIGELIVTERILEGIYSLEQQFIKSMSSAIYWGFIISIFIAIILAIIFSNQITKPLKKLIDGIKQLGSGNTAYRVEVNSSGEFKQLAEAFNEMSTQIEENEKVRKNLMADVAHELRTPLSILAGKIESIQEGVIRPSQETMVQLSDEVYRLSRLVNDLQQLSLAEAGKLPLYKMETNIYELVLHVVNNFEWVKDEKNIDILLNDTDEIICNIDSDRLMQVIINILGNAIRYTPENGEIIITVEKDMIEDMAVIKITDSGPGIAEDQIKHIFNRFYRTDTSRSRDEGGTGLGLSIAKGFVEAHKGNINVESEFGKGSTFIIKVPMIT